jgi:hypothetical protein
LFTLTLTNADVKSVSGYRLPGNSMAARVVPPGSAKFIGTGPRPGQDICASSPVFNLYLRGYVIEIPYSRFTYVAVAGRSFLTLLGAGAGAAAVEGAAVEVFEETGAAG